MRRGHEPYAAWSGGLRQARMRQGVCHSGQRGPELQVHAGCGARWPRADLHQIAELVHNPQATAAAGVAVQTVHAIFGTKLSLAQGIVESAFEDVDPDVRLLVHQADLAQDLRVTLRTVATIARRMQEHFADILLFLDQSGDPQLSAEAERFDTVRVASLAPVVSALAGGGVLRAGLSVAEAADLIWALTSPEWYGLLVRRRGWDANRWEDNLGDNLVRLLLA